MIRYSPSQVQYPTSLDIYEDEGPEFKVDSNVYEWNLFLSFNDWRNLFLTELKSSNGQLSLRETNKSRRFSQFACCVNILYGIT